MTKVEPIKGPEIVARRLVYKLRFQASPEDVTLVLTDTVNQGLRGAFLAATATLPSDETDGDLAFRKRLDETEFSNFLDSLTPLAVTIGILGLAVIVALITMFT